MASPLTTIAHQTREVRRALTNNCWYVYHQAAPVDGAAPAAPARIYQARTRRGQFQVCHQVGGKWHNVGPADILYQH